MGITMTDAEKKWQTRFERLLRKKMKQDTAYTTMEVYLLFDDHTDPGLNIDNFRKKLFRVAIDKKVNHIQKGRIHFWAFGELMLRHEE